MSVALTLDAVRDRSKTVTRRHVGRWQGLAPGDRLTLVEKGQGIPKGGHQVVVAEVEVTDVRVERLGLVDAAEVAAEGFPGHDPEAWRAWWAQSHGHRPPEGLASLRPEVRDDQLDRWAAEVPCRRIEFRYLDELAR